jgi:hypothetical protein
VFPCFQARVFFFLLRVALDADILLNQQHCCEGGQKSDELAWGLPAEARFLNFWTSEVDVVQVWEGAEV